MTANKETIRRISTTDLHNASAKRAYNRRLFEEVAPQYARITRLMSFGRDQTWKKQLINMLPDAEAPTCLDLACGTGDITLALHERFPEAPIKAVDLSEDMLKICRSRCDRIPNIEVLCEDMNAIPAPDHTFDFITGGYAIRNSPDLKRTLREIRRLLKPGGTAAFLDFSRSKSKVLQHLQLGLLSFWGKLWGRLLHRNPHIYGYIAESLKSFPSRGELDTRCKEAGLVILKRKLLFFGFIEMIFLEQSNRA